MLRHVVMITLKENAPDGALANLVDALRKLPDEIHEIRRYEVGSDIVHGPNSAQICLIGDFDDLAALQRYRVHPAHRYVLDALILPHMKQIVACDYEVIAK